MCEIVFAYTRAEAIADGVLRDVSSLAAEAGFRLPVAITSAVWAECVAVPDACPWQDETGRLFDILNMLLFAIRARPAGSEIRFGLMVQNDRRGPKPVTLKALCHPGDNLEPVVTVMLPDED